MPAAVKNNKSTRKKKRKGATASNNDERSGPQKKKYRYNCSADGCNNHARKKGGVCVKHGAKVEYKRCSVEGCTNYEQKGGVCVRHGAKWTKKQCSFDGCTNLAQKGGVCIRHGAKVKRCRFAGCPNQVRRKGVCKRHGAYSDGTTRANIQVQNNLGRDDGNTVSATQISDNDEGGTQPQGIGRKGKAAEKQSNKLISNNSVGGKDEAVLFEKGPITVANIEKPHQQSDDGSSDNEASEDEAPTYTFNGKRYASYQDMCNAKRKRNQDVLDQSGLLDYSKRPPQPVANNKSNKRRKTSIPKKPTRQSKRLSGLNRPDYNEDAARTKSGDDIDRQEEEEEEESKARALEDEEQDPLNDEGRSQAEIDCKGDAAAELSKHTTANGVEREVLSEQDQGQKTLAGSNKRPRINSSSDGDDESKVGGGNDDEASGIVSGGEEQERSQQDSAADGNEVESPQCDDSFDGANQQHVFLPEKEDHELSSEDERKSYVFGHHEGMAFSERESGEAPKDGDIDLPEEVELHQGSALESEQMAFVSKEDAERYMLQMKQMKERNSALEEATNALRSKLAEQVKTAANLQAQLDQVTGENRKLEERMMQDGELWDEERKRVDAQHAAELQEMTAKASAAESQKNRLQMELDSLRAQKQNESGSEAKGNLNSSSRYPFRHGRGSHLHLDGAASARSYETRSQSQRSGGRSTLTATAHTSPKPRLASRSRNNKSNPRSSLETIREGGGAFVGKSRRTIASESKKGKAVSAKLRAELLNVLASTNDIPDVSLDDIIGQEKAKAAMLGLKPFRDPEYACLYEGIDEDSNSNTGILLYGPAGTGKTMFAKAMASNGGCIFIKISPDDILNEYIGKSEERMRGVFLVAKEKAVETGKTAVLFIDECDRLFRKPRNNDCEVTSNITGIFQECMNGITEPKGQLIVLGATNYKEKLPSSILSRFAIKIPINLPGRRERIAIAKRNIKSGHTLTDDDFDQFADMTDGYSGRDIFYLITKGAEPSRIVEAKEHNDAWCKNEEDCYVPCFHSPAHPCRAKESGSFREVKERTKTEKIRPRSLALKHIKMGIDLLGEQEEMLDE